MLLSKRFDMRECPHENIRLKDKGRLCFSLVNPKYITSHIVALFSFEK